MAAPSPCLSCTRTKRPANCNNKNCPDWQQWFTAQWEALRRKARAEMDRAPQLPAGVSIGGQRYIAPHRLREYLQKDPCTSCPFRLQLCTTPCQVRRTWEKAKKEVSL